MLKRELQMHVQPEVTRVLVATPRVARECIVSGLFKWYVDRSIRFRPGLIHRNASQGNRCLE